MTSSEKVGALDDLMPQSMLMAAAWIGSIQYALGQAEMMRFFREVTGNDWMPAKTGLDRMIDEATGAELHFIRAFAKWHNENIWGEENGRPIDAGVAAVNGENA